MTVELRFVTLISNDGITIFHKNYLREELDEYLFSGFSSAMIAFSKELGDELDAIKMNNQSIFYKEVDDDGVLIISVTAGYEIKLVRERLSKLSNSENLSLMLEGSKIGIIQNENELFEDEIDFHFGIISPTKIEEISFPDDDIQELKDALIEMQDASIFEKQDLQSEVYMEALDK